MFQKLSTQKGKMSVAWNGYIYTQKRLTANHIHWRCMDRNCNASLKTPICLDDPDAESFFALMTPHRHQPRPDLVLRQVVRNNLTVRATVTEIPPRDIIRDELQTQSQSNVSVVGTLNGIQQLVNRTRRNSHVLGGVEEEVLQIDESLMVTLRGHRFYQFGPS